MNFEALQQGVFLGCSFLTANDDTELSILGSVFTIAEGIVV